ncbi:histidine phosphatase family protein [Planctomycetota bacterium]
MIAKKNRSSTLFLKTLASLGGLLWLIQVILWWGGTRSMTKKLILLRHAKSDWKQSYVHDFDRPLAKRGKKAAKWVGQVLAALGQLPDIVLTSPAKRAMDTVTYAAKSGAWQCPIRRVDAFYSGDVPDVFLHLKQLPDDITSSLVVGHEPIWSELLGACIGGCRVRFPTAALACVDLDTPTWKDMKPSQGTLLWFLPPRPFSDIFPAR